MRHLLFLISIMGFISAAAEAKSSSEDVSKKPLLVLPQVCVEALKKFPGASNDKILEQACARVQTADLCYSVEGTPIYHYDKAASYPRPKKILVFSLIHGDETHAGTVGRYWMERLESIDPRNSWRVIPILNPDGVKYRTRTNANKVDVNRNFPTRDWQEGAVQAWKHSTKSNPRRFPGTVGGSEPETKCALHHLEEFQPDFVVSVHTPLKVLDFDGPKVKPPRYGYLPWRSLGNFPGSLGRFLWVERNTPVLTMELKEDLPKNLATFDELQDIIGTLVKLETGKKEGAAGVTGTPTSFLPVALED